MVGVLNSSVNLFVVGGVKDGMRSFRFRLHSHSDQMNDSKGNEMLCIVSSFSA
jgi:hypothetical protein